MHAKVQKWGNSLAVRIPKAFALETGMSQDVPVELSVQAGAVVVAPIKAPSYSLAELLAHVTPRNRHGETDFGGRTGNEAW